MKFNRDNVDSEKKDLKLKFSQLNLHLDFSHKAYTHNYRGSLSRNKLMTLYISLIFLSVFTGAPYAGASAQRMGAAALRRFQPTSTANKAVSVL